MGRPAQVAVCGPADCDETERRAAEEVGRLLATAGATVICGGYGGVMTAVAAGASAAGGLVVGVLSGGREDGAAPGLGVVLPTGLGQARNAVIAGSADALIAVGGSWGTLTEIAFALRSGRVPVIQVGGWRVLDANGAPVPGVSEASSPGTAVRMALARVRPGSR